MWREPSVWSCSRRGCRSLQACRCCQTQPPPRIQPVHHMGPCLSVELKLLGSAPKSRSSSPRGWFREWDLAQSTTRSHGAIQPALYHVVAFGPGEESCDAKKLRHVDHDVDSNTHNYARLNVSSEQLVDSFSPPFMYAFIPLLTHSSIHGFISSFIRPLNHPPIHPAMHLSIHPHRSHNDGEAPHMDARIQGRSLPYNFWRSKRQCF